MTTQTITDNIKPLLGAGGLYVLEVGRALLVGGLISAAALVLLILNVPSEGASHRIIVLGVISMPVFTLIYALAGHQRGLARVLAKLTQAHGGMLFDQTVGRFLAATEARKPGALTALVATPQKLADGLHGYLAQVSLRPKWLKRVALRYLGRLADAVGAQPLLPDGVVTQGQFDPEGFKQWAVEAMHEQFSPSWRGFAIVAAVHALCLLWLGWSAR
jgi:hypothetical protein